MLSAAAVVLTGCKGTNVAPTANAGFNQMVTVGDTVYLNGAASDAGDGASLRYNWRILYAPRGSSATLSDATAPDPSFEADRFGTFVVELTVNNGRKDSRRDLISVHVHPVTLMEMNGFSHEGTGGQCVDCHNGTNAQGKSEFHIATSDTCDTCHDMDVWSPAITVDHLEVRGTCVSCHDNTTASGKPATHSPSSDNCGNCHGTSQWLMFLSRWEDDDDDDDDDGGTGAGGTGGSGGTGGTGGTGGGGGTTFNHSTVTSGCAACHNNRTARGKGASHILSTDVCEACHVNSTWRITGKPDHNNILGSCAGCHTQPAGHISTAEECNTCHRVDAWLPLAGNTPPSPTPFDHSTLPATASCSGCHDGPNATATVKPPLHLTTSSDCRACHSTTAWIPVLDNTGGGTGGGGTGGGGTGGGGTGGGGTTPPAAHANLQPGDSCNVCHAGAAPSATTKPVGHVATTNECDVCHFSDVWIPLKRVVVTGFTHTITAGSTCASCHPPLIQPIGHVITSEDCGTCHSMVSWKITGIIP